MSSKPLEVMVRCNSRSHEVKFQNWKKRLSGKLKAISFREIFLGMRFLFHYFHVLQIWQDSETQKLLSLEPGLGPLVLKFQGCHFIEK